MRYRLLLCAWAAPLLAAGSGLQQLKAFVENTHSARAAFAQTVLAKAGDKPQRSSGSFTFARPGKFRWSYDKPYEQLIVGDGEKLWVYDKDLNQVTVKRQGAALGASPAALLAGSGGANGELEKNFKLVDAGSHDGMDWVEATPKAEDSTFQRVRIGFSGDLPRAMDIQDNLGHDTRLTFAGFQRNVPAPGSLFRFVPPAGVDVVGDEPEGSAK